MGFSTSDVNAQYKLNDNAANTTVTDASSNGYDASASENTSGLYSASGKINGCFQWDGSEYISGFPAGTLSASGAVAVWFKTDVASPDKYIFCHKYDDSDSNMFAARVRAIGGALFVDHAGSNTHLGTGYNDGGWHLLIINYSSSGSTVYIDNDEGTSIGNGTITVDNSWLRIGCYYDSGGNSNHWEGELDNVIFFDKQLDATERSFLWNSGNGTEDIFDSLTDVEQSFLNKFEIEGFYTARFDNKFRVLKPAEQSFETRFRVLSPVKQPFETKFAVARYVSQDFINRFQVDGFYTARFDNKFKVLKGVNQNFEAKFRVLTPVEQSFATKFKVLKGVHQDFLNKFAVEGVVNAVLLNKFAIERYASTVLTNKFRVLTPVGQGFETKFQIQGSAKLDIYNKFRIIGYPQLGINNRFQVLSPVEKDITNKFQVYGGVSKPLYNRFLLNVAGIEIFNKFQIRRDIQQTFKNKFMVCSASEGADLPVPDSIVIGGGGTTADDFIKNVWATFKIGTSDDYPIASLTLNRGVNQLTRFTVSVIDNDYEYCNSDGLKPDIDTPRIAWLRYGLNDVGSSYYQLYTLNRTYSTSGEDGPMVNFSGSDFGEKLYRDNMTLETWENQQATAIISEILEEVEMNGTLDIPSFPVLQFDFQQDKPINRIQTLLNEVGAYWRVKDNRFEAWEPKLSNPTFYYYGPQHIYSMEVEDQSIEYYDSVKVARRTKNADLAWAMESTGEGRQNAQLSGVFWAPQVHIIAAYNCTIELFDWFLNGAYVGHIMNLPASYADELYFTVTPTSDTELPYWKMEIRGTPREYRGSGINLDAQYHYNPSGTRPAPVIESNFIATNAMAQTKAEAFMRQQGRIRRTLRMTAQINPYLYPGDTIGINDPASGISGTYNVESIATSINGNEGTDTITVVEYST